MFRPVSSCRVCVLTFLCHSSLSCVRLCVCLVCWSMALCDCPEETHCETRKLVHTMHTSFGDVLLRNSGECDHPLALGDSAASPHWRHLAAFGWGWSHLSTRGRLSVWRQHAASKQQKKSRHFLSGGAEMRSTWSGSNQLSMALLQRWVHVSSGRIGLLTCTPKEGKATSGGK